MASVRTSREEQLAPFFGAAGTVLAVLVCARTLASFAHIIQPYLRFTYGAWLEAAMVLCQVLFQWAIMARRSWPERLRYAGLALGVSVLGAVLLWPILLLHSFAPVTMKTAIGCFFGVVSLMFVVHWLFVGYLKMPRILCATWVVYRLILLVILVRF